jgi:outer membrane protein assembly factor BamC
MNNVLIIIFSLFLIGCSALDEGIDKITQPDYVSSSKAKKLEIPPDLSDMGDGSNVYTIPGEAKSYKDYKSRQNGSEPTTAKIGIRSSDMKIVKSGTLRWLVVKKEPDILWTHVEAFWEDMGFEIRKSSKRTGVMETEWIKTSDLDRNNSGGALSTFDRWLDSMSGFADRRKFRTRVEAGQEPGTTEIYLSQRSAAGGSMEHERILRDRKAAVPSPTDKLRLPEYISDDDNDAKGEKLDISEERKLDDYEIDSELLTRLMIKLGASDLDAKKIVKNPTTEVRAEYIAEKNQKFIKLNDPFDRSWRRLTLALDIIGFITEDKNRSEGILYVRYKNLELAEGPKGKDKGMLDSLAFWRNDNEEVIDDVIEKSEIDPMAPKNKKGKSKEKDNSEEDKLKEELEVKKLPEDNEEAEFKKKTKREKEKPWIERLSWGADDEKILSKDERGYRIRIVPLGNGAKVYIDYPDGRVNNTSEARRILKIMYEHLK